MKLAHFVLFIGFIQFSFCDLGCLDDNGNAVDWFIFLKAPDGYSYAYMDSNNPTLEMSSNTLNTSDNALAYTLQQVFSSLGSDDVAYLLYNDETPDNVEHPNWGHTKGGIAFDSSSGFWLVHSVPRFPDTSIDYIYPKEETEFGQSFLCMTYPKNAFNQITGQFLITKPWVYESNGPSSIISSIPNFQAVISQAWITAAANQSVSLTTSGGSNFISFAKNIKWDNYLYESFVEPFYNTGLWVESWMNGADKDKMPTFCKGSTYAYDCINVREVELPSGPTYKETKDHSKWAASLSSSIPVVCIGDINRQYSQSNRGGGTACMVNSDVWGQFKSLIASADSC